MSSCVGGDLGRTEVLCEVERILESDSFRRSETHRRLLVYLTDRSLSEEADQLKEYTIGVDVFGKSKDYDTRLDSGVRIQVGRLRQKLTEYYSADGINDEIIVALPKGHFKLLFERRLPGPTGHGDALAGSISEGAIVKSREALWRRAAIILGASLLAALVWGSIGLRHGNQDANSELRWTGAMETFWRPFVLQNRPLILAMGAPLFIGLRGCCFYRDLNNNSWEEAIQDPNFKTVRKALNNPDFFAGRSYTTVGDAKSVLLLGMLLGRRIPKIDFVRSSDLSWQQLSDSNALFVGGMKTFSQLLNALPVKPEMILEKKGLRIVHPQQGEPAFFPDPTIDASGLVADDAELPALISVFPAPDGRGVVGSFLAGFGTGSFAASGSSGEGFAANLGAGSLAAVEYATNPESVEDLIRRIKDREGRVPRYFQVALGVRFKGGVPISSRYLLSREVRLEANVPKKDSTQ